MKRHKIKRYRVVARGRKRFFADFDAAQQYVNDYYRASKCFVAIELVETPAQREAAIRQAASFDWSQVKTA